MESPWLSILELLLLIIEDIRLVAQFRGIVLVLLYMISHRPMQSKEQRVTTP